MGRKLSPEFKAARAICRSFSKPMIALVEAEMANHPDSKVEWTEMLPEFIFGDSKTQFSASYMSMRTASPGHNIYLGVRRVYVE